MISLGFEIKYLFFAFLIYQSSKLPRRQTKLKLKKFQAGKFHGEHFFMAKNPFIMKNATLWLQTSYSNQL